jgi:hypothetical protein
VTIEEALAFLASHQVMPKNSTQADVARLDDVRRYLALHPDPRALPLVFGLFADHMGWGIFQLFDEVLAKFSAPELTRHLRMALAAPDRGTRWWATQWSLAFPSQDLTPELISLLAKPGDEDAHYFAIATLGEICKSEFNPTVLKFLRARHETDADPERRDLLRELVAELGRHTEPGT